MVCQRSVLGDRNRIFDFEAPFQKADFQAKFTGPPISLENDAVTPATPPKGPPWQK
jgi:hypothetical protein